MRAWISVGLALVVGVSVAGESFAPPQQTPPGVSSPSRAAPGLRYAPSNPDNVERRYEPSHPLNRQLRLGDPEQAVPVPGVPPPAEPGLESRSLE